VRSTFCGRRRGNCELGILRDIYAKRCSMMCQLKAKRGECDGNDGDKTETI